MAIKARPATIIPVTAPPLKARPRPAASPFLAASAVLTLAITDTRIPIYPAMNDATAPIKNPMAVFAPRVAKIIMKIMIPAIPILLSWRFKYAIAPS